MKLKLKKILEEKNINESKLAEMVGISRQAINYFIHTADKPSLPIAFKIADVLGMSVDEVFEDIKEEVLSKDK